jgi:hypothetical protein
MRQLNISLAMSVIALIWWAAGLVFPTAHIDLSILFLLAVLNLSRITSIIKSIELPGGIKITFREEDPNASEVDKCK